MKTKVPHHEPRDRKLAIPQSCAAAAECLRSHALELAARNFLRRGCIALLIALSLAISAPAQNPPEDLSKPSVEDLMNVEVTSVSKKEQKVSQTAAAIFVITQEDIRRSGANNIPDLLRMVPGVNVAQINSNVWAISIQGFDGEFSNKLLVMVDGRSVYLPSFSGVFWDVLDLPLEDIARIEVIRGPGGTTWGANAVDGVINIITTNASENHGGMVVAGVGNLNQGFGTAQSAERASADHPSPRAGSASRLRSLAHTAGRRQSGESAPDDALARKQRPSSGACDRWPRSPRYVGKGQLRPGADGYTDAGDEWPGSYRQNSRERKNHGRPSAHRRPDRARHERRSGTLPRKWHGWIFGQACSRARTRSNPRSVCGPRNGNHQVTPTSVYRDAPGPLPRVVSGLPGGCSSGSFGVLIHLLVPA
jgi:outer membrane receptor protein involved in Fe transport